MAAPSVPANPTLQTGNAQVLFTWDQSTNTPTSYTVQRSADNITYSTIGSPTVESWLDTTATPNTKYWYKVLATNGSGSSAYSTAVFTVPTISGEMTLAAIRDNAKKEADQVNSQFLTDVEWNFNINNSLFELYDLLIGTYDDYYFAQPAYFNTNGTTAQYSIPNGITSFNNASGVPFVAPPLYKLLGVDLGINNSPTGWVTMKKYTWSDRNRYFYPNTQSTIYGVFNMQYRQMGDYLEFIPLPSGNQPLRIWYVPRMVQLLQDTDVTSQGVSGWLEYVIVDAAIKAMQKEESDPSVLLARKEALKRRIEASASNRDQGQPDTISDTRWNTGSGQGGGVQGFGGGF